MKIPIAALLPILAGMLIFGPPAGRPNTRGPEPTRQRINRTDEEIDAQEKLRDERFGLDKALDTLAILPGMTVAEIGAGEGYLVIKLASRVADGAVWAEDIAPRFLEALKRRAARRGLANINRLVGEAGDPHLPGGAFDMIFMHTTYHFLEDPATFFGALVPALKPGGRIVVIEMERDRAVNVEGKSISGFPTREDYLDVFGTAKLKVGRIDDRTMPHHTIFVLLAGKASRIPPQRSASLPRLI